MLTELADEPLVDDVFPEADWSAHNLPLRLLAALHYLALDGRASWDDLRSALRDHGAFLRRFVSEQRVQTNEVQRSWFLLPCFLEVARRSGAEELDVVELGTSAGLNLVWDRYAYRYVHGRWGPRDAAVELAGEERRPVPAALLGLAPRVGRRIGVDVAPVDVTDEHDVRVLKSFVWPDQAWRLEQLERVVAVVREDPPQIVHGDAVEELPRILDELRGGALTLVFATAFLNYLERERRQELRETLARVGSDRPLAFVWTGQPAPDVHTYWGIHVQLWPGGEREVVVHADFQGAWLDWVA